MFNSKFTLYILDCETTGLDYKTNDIIELSAFRLNDDVQKTWFLKPRNYETITQEALRKNGHKIEDLKHFTEYGKQTYLDPKIATAEIENFFMSDGSSSSDRILIGQNVNFDLQFIRELWDREGLGDAFPFGKRTFIIDTLQLDLFFDIVKNDRNNFYNLGSLVERYKVKKEKAHRADADVRMTKDVFLEQIKRASNIR